MSNPAPILRITDGTTHIDLIGASGFELKSWTPMRPALKNGGNRRSSPLSDGSQLISAHYENIIDSIELLCHQSSQDQTIWERQELDRLLIKAREYWTTDWQSEPVWIEARGTYETNSRYSVIVNYEMLPDADPYATPFAQLSPFDSTQDSLTLMLEHQFWLAEEPGTVVCVEASGGGDYLETPSGGVGYFVPTAQADDCYTTSNATISVAATSLEMGSLTPFTYDTGVRFRGVTIPRGAKIKSAYIKFQADANKPGTICNLKIVGEDSATPAIFTTYADFWSRERTSASVPWTNVALLGIGTSFDTPDITDIVQEVVNLNGWAHGNDLTVFAQNAGSSGVADRSAYSWDGAGNEPRLYVEWQMGQEPTCERDVYVANKHNMAQLTDSYTWATPAGPFSANLIGGALPEDLFAGGAAGPAAGDITYFGCDSTIANSGPFCSLVFDIGTAATYAGAIGVDFVTWQYWNGGWVNLPIDDMTSTVQAVGATSQPWSELGVNSIHWEQPSDWTTTVINGVTAYWVRAVVTEGNAIGRALQVNRDIYTITWPYLDISATSLAGAVQLPGDIPLLARLTTQGVSPDVGGIASNIQLDFRWGLRSLSRGADFTPYINLADEQNHAGITVSVADVTGFATTTLSATGRVARYSVAGAAGFTQEAGVAFSTALAPQYYGAFHLFCRYWSSTGTTGDVRFYVRINSGAATFTTRQAPVTVSSQWQVADLGRISLPLGPNLGPSVGQYYMNMDLYVSNTPAAARVVDFMDFILMPVDEWFTFLDGDSGYLSVGQALEIDSATRPRQMLTSHSVRVGDTYIVFQWAPHAAGPLILQANADQRLWYFADGYVAGAYNISEPHYAVRCDLDAVGRYLSMRGNR